MQVGLHAQLRSEYEKHLCSNQIQDSTCQKTIFNARLPIIWQSTDGGKMEWK